MNIETINKWLDEEYGCSYTRLEELHDFYFEKYCDLQQENKQLKEIYKELFNTYQKLKKENEEFKLLNLHQVDKIQQLKEEIEENKKLKEQLLVAQTNEETFRLEMEDITKTLGLDKDTLFDDVKVYARSLKDNWDKLKEIARSQSGFKKRAGLKGGVWFEIDDLLDKMQELEGSDNDE